MLLTITTTHRPATDLGFLLHKHPDRYQTFPLNFGTAHVFYPECTDERCTVALALDVDAIELQRNHNADQAFTLGQYVNDRPYVASSFLSNAISRVFSSALNGTCNTRPELVTTPIPLVAELAVLPVTGGERFLREVFEPLGYTLTCTRHPLDEQFPEWGPSRYYAVNLAKTTTLSELLSQLFVLIPVFDGRKHYYIAKDEIEKLLDKGAGWLAKHPLREEITRRYFARKGSLYKEAMAKLQEEIPDEDDTAPEVVDPETRLERTMHLNEQRHEAVVGWITATGARKVLDLGCGEGKLLKRLRQNRQFEEIVGVDVSISALEIAARRLKLEGEEMDRVKLLHGSLMYRDERFAGYDAATVVEVIEHLDPPRLTAFERVVFEFARPRHVVITTPNQEYNATWETLSAGEFRHADHRFEWTRAEFQTWATNLAEKYGYQATFHPIGPESPTLGSPTQAAVFKKRG
ncbi:MAG: 3' terminal RNA ribose 2'-O-methyltransferase Hen1 [Fimbriiglobus sp.]